MYLLISGILSSYLIWALPNNIMNYDLWRNILLAWQIQSKKKGLTCNKKVVFCFAALWSTCQSEACWKNAAYNQKRCRSLASDEEPALQKPADQMEDQTTESPGAFHLSLTCFLRPSKSLALFYVRVLSSFWSLYSICFSRNSWKWPFQSRGFAGFIRS